LSHINYYKISIIGSPLQPFTYKSSKLLQQGTLVSVEFHNRIKNGVVVEECLKPDFKTSDILEIGESIYSKKQFQLAKFISSYYICSLGDALNLMVPFELKSLKDNVKSSFIEYSIDIKLSLKQQKAFSFLKRHHVSLLFGDTGSGKTEIYMSYFSEILASGKRSIFLMPEISLTPQMNQRLEKYFGKKVVMWHSKLTPLQKRKALSKIHDGTAYIIAGPRSALFLPIKDLGVIVVDEEHDDSYKSASRPRYNARDIAIYMGKLYNVPVVLGSATPSLTSYVKFAHTRLRGTHFDSNKEFIYEKGSENISPLILKSIKNILNLKEQAIIFLPTRANFKYLICKDCGHTYECVFCSIGMSIHQKSHALKCHYCNYTQAIPQICSLKS